MVTSLTHTELVWVDQPLKLQQVVEELSSQNIISVDTESNSLYAYQEQVCLIQFSTPKKDYLIDTIALRDLSPLGEIFRSASILKVFHAAEYDLICMFRDFGFHFNFLFDTMIAARTLGYQKVGLGDLMAQFFDLHIDKKYQRANWGKRPLKEEMLAYARLDSHFLIPLQEKLRAELKESDRWDLALEDFRRLTKGIEDTTESCITDFWKLPGAHKLDPHKAAVLKSVYQFREEKAEDQDRPTFKVISHRALVSIAEECPQSANELEHCHSMSRKLVSRYGKGLLKAVRQGLQCPPEYPPQYHHPTNSTLNRIEALRDWRKHVGRQMQVPSDVVLPRDVLTRIAWKNPQDIATLEEEMWDVPYRFNRFGEQIFHTVQKEQHTS